MQFRFRRIFNFTFTWWLLVIGVVTSLGNILLPVYAASNSGAISTDIGQKTFSFGVYFLQAGLSLLLMGIVGLAIVFYMRRFGGVNNKKNQFMKMIGTHSLSSRDKLIIMKVCNKYLLLAVSPGNVRLLHKFDNGFDPIVNEEKQIEHFPKKYSQFVRYFVDSLERGKGS